MGPKKSSSVEFDYSKEISELKEFVRRIDEDFGKVKHANTGNENEISSLMGRLKKMEKINLKKIRK